MTDAVKRDDLTEVLLELIDAYFEARGIDSFPRPSATDLLGVTYD